jgi:hypothetical protein
MQNGIIADRVNLCFADSQSFLIFFLFFVYLLYHLAAAQLEQSKMEREIY